MTVADDGIEELSETDLLLVGVGGGVIVEVREAERVCVNVSVDVFTDVTDDVFVRVSVSTKVNVGV